jgi:hypothetical protein
MTSTPMNISPQNISGDCNLKCAYSFKYKPSSSSATNYGTYIKLTYDQGSVPPVIFNTVNYDVSEIDIYSPSIHQFNNSLANAEIVIKHLANGSTNYPLYVCIPITSNGSTTSATQTITDIISSVASGAPTTGESVAVQFTDPNFTLDKIVPFSAYYNYTGQDNVNYIVYGLKNAITIPTTTLTSLQSVIGPMTQVIAPTTDLLFLNPTGPVSGVGDNEIYIDCKPTGNSEETVEVTNTKSQTQNDLGNIFSSPLFMFIISAFIFVILIVVIHSLLVGATSGKNPFAKMTKMS